MLAPAHWLLLQDTENVSWNSDRPRVEDNTGIPSQNHNEESLKNPHHTKQGKGMLLWTTCKKVKSWPPISRAANSCGSKPNTLEKSA